MTEIAAPRPLPTLSAATILFVIGIIAVIVPTMMFVGRESWSQETGAHGPIVLFTGLWLLRRRWLAVRSEMEPAPTLPVALLTAIILPLYLFSRVTQIVEIEGYLMYALVLICLYSVVGFKAMKLMWFPLFYMLFVFPPPDTLIALITQPLKIFISQAAIGFLHLLGYPIGGAGVMIQIGQYQLLVAAACSGLNSLVSLSAISLFYIYIRHQANWRYALLLGFMIIPVAVIANFIRVLILILLTYHLGEAAAQSFLHDFAGITMFLAAVLTIFAIDSILEPIWRRINKSGTES
ncbi:exosortase [Parasphingorhabdus marina DSM 22363]|uniref:Exosortase n=1 Tax=Parasphingorhabdus marina DSM 22363 TaxID=1123272 RepID=A0A1N6CPW4_9SPHN|nr:exosortase V [Parasphingorhabdus marina]SIN60404.1 exosortase [Parasphingorhabdus marina DSM 22363]